MMLALIYGGSGSGKSELAENLLAARRGRGPLVYLATMAPVDAEARERIARHRANRARKGFVTIERYTDVASAAIPEGASVLLECLGNLTANEMFSPSGAGPGTAEAILKGLATLGRRAARLFVVSNDVFRDGADYSPETEDYRRTLAGLNRTLARDSAAVVETVCGIALWHKRTEDWTP